MILIFILVGGILLVITYCMLMWWLCGGRRMEQRIEVATKLRARAMADYVDAIKQETEALRSEAEAYERATREADRKTEAHKREAEAWRQATEAEKSATAAWEREAKAAEKIAEELRAMDDNEMEEFFGRIFNAPKKTRRRGASAPPSHGNFDRN